MLYLDFIKHCLSITTYTAGCIKYGSLFPRWNKKNEKSSLHFFKLSIICHNNSYFISQNLEEIKYIKRSEENQNHEI